MSERRNVVLRLAALAATSPLLVLGAFVSTVAAPAGAATGDGSFSKAETISRVHLLNGVDTPVVTRNLSVNISQTQSLRDRQGVDVSWLGAHPTAGLVADTNSAAAAQQEYPVVVMECRGVDSDSVPVAQRLSPSTCWTQTPSERFQADAQGFSYPPFRMDRYASQADRAFVAGAPSPYPNACSGTGGAEHWVPFVATDGTVYPGGNQGCAGLPPEEANGSTSLQPGSTTYGRTDSAGHGSAKFIVQNADSNASLGCSDKVACSLVVIPIIGISCDPAGVGNAGDNNSGMPIADRPDSTLIGLIQSGSSSIQGCGRAGQFAAGDFNSGGSVADLAVTGSLWWSASNWKGRISVPLNFAPSPTVCNVLAAGREEVDIYGSQAMLQATQQWSPAFCLNPALFTVKHVQTSEPQAKNLLATGSIEAAFVGGPPATPFPRPIVQAPAAVSGFAIAIAMDGANGKPYGTVKMDARLIAKLLTESYPSNTVVAGSYPALSKNSVDLGKDPEFQALNPSMATDGYPIEPASTIAAMSSDSDVMTAVTSYINADREARVWLDGKPDPWGMVVNPNYKKIALPVASWPQLDTFKPVLNGNPCYSLDPVPWLPLMAAPLSNPSSITLNMQFAIANSQVICANAGAQNQKLVAFGRESPGSRLLVGIVSLADAERYQLPTAALETSSSANTDAKFTDSSNRSFATATTESLKVAAALLKRDTTLGTWLVPYDTLRSSIGTNAYPGVMLLSVDVPTTGLPKAHAARYATFLRFVAGAGQKSGLSVGQLPPGYLPLTADNGLGALAAYTTSAANAVELQRGSVPPTPVIAPSQGSNGTATAAAGSGNGNSGSALLAGGSSTPASSAAAPAGGKAAPSNTSATSAPSIQAVPLGKTTGATSGPLGIALPVLAVLGLIGAVSSAWIGRLGRR